MNDPRVEVVRLDESDYGTEVRIVVHLSGEAVELVVCDGTSGFCVDLTRLGPDLADQYEGMQMLYRGQLYKPGAKAPR